MLSLQLWLYFVCSVGAQRFMTLQNHCVEPVTMHVEAGSAPYARPSISKCMSDTDCARGASCNMQNYVCYWIVPLPLSGSWLLQPGQSTQLSFSVYMENDLVFSGKVTACYSNNCDGPNTDAEFTLPRTGVDFYDISIINGMNVPLSMGPSDVKASELNPQEPYNCGLAGGASPITGVSPSSWSFTPPLPEYVWVTTGGVPCTSNENCGMPGLVCGLSNNVGVANRLQLNCGTQLGYWTADEVCGFQPNFVGPWGNCSDAVAAPNVGGMTKWNLFACNNGVGSCYQDGASNACCGCSNWATSPAVTTACKNTNENWKKIVLPTLEWLKNACPTCYTYPYDDVSSTFTCSRIVNSLNVMPYTITSCPTRSALTDLVSDTSVAPREDEVIFL